jgi:hypothetical protein
LLLQITRGRVAAALGHPGAGFNMMNWDSVTNRRSVVIQLPALGVSKLIFFEAY